MPSMTDVTRILDRVEQGDRHAAAELLPLVYDELRKLAAKKLAQEKPGQTLNATALVHEAYLRSWLGEGGMGEVWVVDQTEPVQRRVALKVVRPGLDSARMLAHFEQERQALALMDHPNIARVLDVGVAEGRPYFVMVWPSAQSAATPSSTPAPV